MTKGRTMLCERPRSLVIAGVRICFSDTVRWWTWFYVWEGPRDGPGPQTPPVSEPLSRLAATDLCLRLRIGSGWYWTWLRAASAMSCRCQSEYRWVPSAGLREARLPHSRLLPLGPWSAVVCGSHPFGVVHFILFSFSIRCIPFVLLSRSLHPIATVNRRRLIFVLACVRVAITV
jgi:hypothetical protein